MKITTILSAEGQPLARLRWDNRTGTGRLTYLRPNLDGLTVPINSEALAKATLTRLAKNGCSFRVTEADK